MMSFYHKNVIITGYIDHYCLVCESHLKTEEDINIHTAKPIHKKNVDACHYFEKFKDDCIRKVKKGYYCEFCNVLLATATKVGLHIAEAKHITNKGAQQLKRIGNSIVASGDILIPDKAWQGLIDDTCAACNMEFQNENIHKAEPTHILNVVQSNIEFRADKIMYRMIDESSFQCLTCNEMLALSSLTTHFDQAEHKKLITKYTEPQPHILDANTDVKKTEIVQESAVQKQILNEIPVDKSPKESNDNNMDKAPMSDMKTEAETLFNKTAHQKDQVVTKTKLVEDEKFPVEKSAVEKAATEKSAAENSAVEKSTAEKAAVEKSAAEKSTKKQNITTTCTQTGEVAKSNKESLSADIKSLNAGKPAGIAKKKVEKVERGTQSTIKYKPKVEEYTMFINLPKDGKAEKRTETPKMFVRPEIGTRDFDEAICEVLSATNYITENDNGKKWCLLCDWGMDRSVVESHLQDRHHQTMLKMHTQRLLKSAQEFQGLPDKVGTRSIITDNYQVKITTTECDECDAGDRWQILENVDQLQDDDINIDFLTETAVCNKCSKDIDFSYAAMSNHIEEHKSSQMEDNKKSQKKEPKVPTLPGAAVANDKKTVHFSIPVPIPRKEGRSNSFSSTQEVDEETETFARENEFILNTKDGRLYCYTCSTPVPYTLKNMKEHVSGTLHKNKTGKTGNGLSKSVKTPMKDFIKTVATIDNGFMKDIVINKKFCLNMLSFLMITKDAKLRCLPCRVTLDMDEVDSHKATPSHEKAMAETPIISSLENEFVREIRTDFFHCGFCNSVETSREELEKHLKSAAHRESKTSSKWRYQQYVPELSEHRQQRHTEATILLNFLMNGNLI